MTTVRFTLDPQAPPALTAQETQHYDMLQESEINYTDSPPLTSAFFASAWKAQSIPSKEKISVRLDSDVLEWLRSYGKGYQTRINDILRLTMQQHKP